LMIVWSKCASLHPIPFGDAMKQNLIGRLIAFSLVAAFSMSLLSAPVGADYADLIQSDSPRFYLQRNEANGSTVATDSSGNGRNGSYHQFPSDNPVTIGVAGIPGGGVGNTAASFGGSANISQVYVADANTASLNDTYSLEAWVNPTTGQVAGKNILVRTSNSGPTTRLAQTRHPARDRSRGVGSGRCHRSHAQRRRADAEQRRPPG